VNSARFITTRPPRTRNREIAKAADVAITNVNAPTATADDGVQKLSPEIAQEVMLLVEHDPKIIQRRMIRPQLAGKRILLRRDREQEHVIDRDQRPDQHGNADQQQPRFGADFTEGWYSHRTGLFISRAVSS
jgi:hypothetical protein